MLVAHDRVDCVVRDAVHSDVVEVGGANVDVPIQNVAGRRDDRISLNSRKQSPL